MEVSGSLARAYVFLHPGLFVEAPDVAGALRELPAALRDEQQWLAARGAPDLHATEPVEIWEVERIDLGTDVSRGRWVGAFRYERRPTQDADVRHVLARTGMVRAALEEILLEPGAGAGAAEAVAALLAAHADAEWELLARLGSRPAGDRPEEPLARLRLTRTRAEDRLLHLLPGDRERHAVFAGEEWTTRKVLRALAVGERRLYAGVARHLGRTAPRSFGGPGLTTRDTSSA